MTKVIVCGDRNWTAAGIIDRELEALALEIPKLTIVEGCARGADTMAESWAYWYEVPIIHHPADWDRYGKAAGSIRNREMLNEGPVLVVAFHKNLNKSRGTRHMVEIARAAGVPIRLYGGLS